MYQKLGILLVVISILLAACAGQPASQTTVEPPVQEEAVSVTEAPQPEAVVETEEPEAEAESADVFRIAMTWDAWSLDPAFGYGSWAADMMLRMTYDTLIRMRGQPYTPEMLLAESFEANSDFTQWTFTLNKNAVFHDGKPVTAQDVKWSWDRVFALGGDVMSLWSSVADADSAKVIDDQTIQFTLKGPFADFIATMPYFYIANSELVRSNAQEGDFGEEKDYGQAWLASNEAGSGPYALESFEPNNQHSFTAVNDYWFGWLNADHMDKIIVKIMPSSSTQKLSLQKGDIDWAGDLEPEDFLSLKDEAGIVTNLRGSSYYMLMMNNQVGPTADVNVRKAIAYSFNYDAMLQAVIGEMPEGLFASSVPGFVALDMPKYDLDKAKEYLAKSAYPDGGFEITFRYLADYKPDEISGLLVKEGLAQLNATVNLVPTEWTQYFELCQSAETAASMESIEYPTQFAMSLMLEDRYNSANWGTVNGCSFYKNEEVDSMLSSLKSNPDAETIAKIQQTVIEDMPSLLMYIYGYKQAYTDRLQGLDEQYPYPYPPYPQDLYYAP